MFRAIVATLARMQGGMLSHESDNREADDLRARTHQEITNRRKRFPCRFIIVLERPGRLKTSAVIVRIPVKTELIICNRLCVCALNESRTTNTSDQNEVSRLHLELLEPVAEQELQEPAGRTEALAGR